MISQGKWCCQRESDSRPLPYQESALCSALFASVRQSEQFQYFSYSSVRYCLLSFAGNRTNPAPQAAPQLISMALTDTRLRNLRPTGKRFEIPDRDGLALRVSQSGVMTWAVSFRVHGAGSSKGSRVTMLAGEKQRLTLGQYPTVSLAEAREKALQAKRLARSGVSPCKTPAVVPQLIPTVKALFDRYHAEHLTRNHRQGTSVGLVLQRHILPALGERELKSIDRHDLLKLLEIVRVPHKQRVTDSQGREHSAMRGGPGAAADVRKWAIAMFQFGVEIGLLEINPFSGIRNRERQVRRDHVLTMEELKYVSLAAASMPYPWGPFFQLLLLTGDRRGEWANARSSWLDADFTRLEIPSSNYKTGKVQVVPLSQQAAAIARSLPKQQFGPYILSSTGGSRPISGFSKAKAEIDRLIFKISNGGIRPWVVHDLRRSMATHMERIGVEPHIIEVCLGHALSGVAGVYRHYTYLPEKAAALQKWADEVTSIKVLRD